VLVFAQLLSRPTYALALALGVIGVALAWKSVAWPLGLAGVPTVIAAVAGSNPLPKGGTTFLLGAWVGLAVLLILMRRQDTVAPWALFTVPVAMAVLLLGMMLLRLGPSLDPSYGSTKLQLYVADNLIFMVGAIFVGAETASRRLFLKITLTVMAAGALYLLFKLLTGAAEQFSGRFSISVQEGPIYLGRDSATGVLIATWLILASRGRTRLLAALALPLMIISLIAAGSRGPVVAFAVGFGVMLAFAARTRRARRRIGAVVGLLLLAAVLVPLLLPGSAIGRSLSTIIGSASGLSSNGRSAIWAQAWTEFSRHLAFGIGTGGYGGIDPINAYPHNILLEVGVELGVIGLVALVVMIGSMLRRLVAVWRWTPGDISLEASLYIGLFVMALVNAFFSGAIQDNRDIWIWGGIGVAMYTRMKLTEGRPVDRLAAAKAPADVGG
jgi:O-antigen ligase